MVAGGTQFGRGVFHLPVVLEVLAELIGTGGLLGSGRRADDVIEVALLEVEETPGASIGFGT